ncbi:Uncharacterized conserved protein YdhG, YjbR/CyaY-like superfamily, DUF1801 family [Agromyces sp. CF514]|uniref:hypothetical protein n=1 Tax=Agromyces sp. CF514 TaxID=1881031 RepID=UPI0008F34917|nr:hypothetical protein [Agromyces sp. CF514]SFR74566.1 Uncharacterized conserved protein YdhG, YjbR/CyaY-like superfamily, DUF1801 family [Agromyces sp. CF514]
MSDVRDTKTGFSDEERAAMQQRAEEIRQTKGLKGAAKLAKEVEACVAAIDGLEGVDKEIGVLLNRVVAEVAPDLSPKTFYGFPAYAADGKVVVFYQPASKFGTRYGTVNFDETARLDDGDFWPTSFAVLSAGPEIEARLRELVQRAIA